MGVDHQRTCTKCGKKWDLYKAKTIMRDTDSIECDCGETLISWNGAVMFNAKPSHLDSK